MRTFQLILSILTVLMALGMFGFNVWVGSNFSKGLPIPTCYMPMNVITTALVLVTAVTIWIKR
jgi:purine-cytosine permease-like protein